MNKFGKPNCFSYKIDYNTCTYTAHKFFNCEKWLRQFPLTKWSLAFKSFQQKSLISGFKNKSFSIQEKLKGDERTNFQC